MPPGLNKVARKSHTCDADFENINTEVSQRISKIQIAG